MLNRVELAHIRELKSSLWTAARVPAEDKNTHAYGKSRGESDPTSLRTVGKKEKKPTSLAWCFL